MKPARLSPTRLHVWTLAATLLIPGLTGCSNSTATTSVEQFTEAPAGQPATGRIGVGQFASVLNKPGVQIIDVRTPEEFADGHIRGAVNIPVQQADFAARVAQLDPGSTYAVYCRSGNRSKGAVAQMKNAGILNIYELAEGTNGWSAEGLPLTR